MRGPYDAFVQRAARRTGPLDRPDAPRRVAISAAALPLAAVVAVTAAVPHVVSAQPRPAASAAPSASASAAPAGEAPVNDRRRLLEDARRAQDAGDYLRALDLAQRAAAIEMSPALRWFMARQLRGLRRYNEALQQTDQCMRDLSRDPGSARTLEGCRQFSGEIRTGYSRLQFRFSRRPPDGMRLRANNIEVPRDQWDSEWYVDSGTVHVVCELPGGAVVERRVDVFPGRLADARLEIPASAAGRPQQPDVPPPPVTPPTRGPGPGPWIVAGIGGAITASTIAWFLLRNDWYDLSREGCDANGGPCPEANRPDYDMAQTFNTLTNITLFAGPAVIAGGVLWFALAPRRPAPAPATPALTPAPSAAPGAPAPSAAPARAVPILSVTPWAGPTGFGLRGVF